MNVPLILLIVILFVLLGGGYYRHSMQWFSTGTPLGYGFAGFDVLVIVIILILLATGYL